MYREHEELDIVIDIVASAHVVANKSYLGNMEKIPTMPADLANMKNVNAKHKGIVSVDFVVRKPASYGVHLIPLLNFNITSCSSLHTYGITSTFAHGICTLNNSHGKTE